VASEQEVGAPCGTPFFLGSIARLIYLAIEREDTPGIGIDLEKVGGAEGVEPSLRAFSQSHIVSYRPGLVTYST
jgi:hypothetical protein